MNVPNRSFQELEGLSLSPDEHALRRVRRAREFEESGDYEAARDALGELWPSVGQRPRLEGLGLRAQAEVLLRAGVLTGLVGGEKAVERACESAKDLITESLSIFEALGDRERVAEAHIELASAYWRQESLDEARLLLREALARLAGSGSELEALALMRSAVVECSARRLNESLLLYAEAGALFERLDSHTLKGRYHSSYANLLYFLAEAEQREEYSDRALVEFTAAAYHFEQAGHARYHACVENNLGQLLLDLDRHEEAHEHLERARTLFTRLRDGAHLAQVEETRARVLLAEGHTAEAERVARAAVRRLEKGDERSPLAAALVTHGRALARLGEHARARSALRQAAELAEQAGDTTGAGRAAITLIEELGERMSARDISANFERAAGLLEGSKHLGDLARLSACAGFAVRALARKQEQASARETIVEREERADEATTEKWNGFSLKHEVQRYEAELIERALHEADGVVSRAAQLLGFKHHQTFIALLNNRHKNLLHARNPIVPRKRQTTRTRSRTSRRTTR